MENFIQKNVTNTVATIHPVPGKIKAEEFYFQSGIVVENALDIGFGQNLSYLDAGDYADYAIDVAQSGVYQIDYRTASNGSVAGIVLQLLDDNGNTSTIHGVTFPETGGWQTWETSGKTALLNEGRQNIRVLITQPNFNLNWIEFSTVVENENLTVENDILVYPNPSDGVFFVQGILEKKQDVEIRVYNVIGQLVFEKNLYGISDLNEKIDLGKNKIGNYLIRVQLECGQFFTIKILKD